eukprot:gene6800-7567_t
MEREVSKTRRCKSSLPRITTTTTRPSSTRGRAYTVGSVPGLISAKELRLTIYVKDKRLYQSDFAYFTLLTNESSLPAALLLGWTLQRSQTKHDTVIMVTDCVGNRSRNLLKMVFNRIVKVDFIGLKIDDKSAKEPENKIYAEYMTKCNLFQFIEYKKILFIDVSVRVERNIDELFEIEAPAGVSSFVSVNAQERWHGYHLPREHVIKSLQLSRGIRTSLMLLTPSISLYHYCCSRTRKYGNYHFIHPDEEFFSKLFINTWTHIHVKFAVVPWQVPNISKDVGGICLNSFKPWQDNCRELREISEWRMRAIQMLKDCPQFERTFRRYKWFDKLQMFHNKESSRNSTATSISSLYQI